MGVGGVITVELCVLDIVNTICVVVFGYANQLISVKLMPKFVIACKWRVSVPVVAVLGMCYVPLGIFKNGVGNVQMVLLK